MGRSQFLAVVSDSMEEFALLDVPKKEFSRFLPSVDTGKPCGLLSKSMRRVFGNEVFTKHSKRRPLKPVV